MVKKIFKGLAILLCIIVVVATAFYTKVYFSTQSRLNKIYAVNAPALEIVSDSAILAKGKKLSSIKACTECHGPDLAGKIIHEDFLLGRLTSANLTKGKGGLNDYSEKDWVLALKHGIREDGKPLIFMPSHEFTLLSEEDMRALISYLDQIPPVDKILPGLKIGPLSRILADIGDFPLIPAEKIDHNRVLIKSVKEEISIEYGKYLSTTCQGCHKESMKGGDPIAPGSPIVADLTSTGNPGKWSDEQFIQTLRTGTTPEGKVLKPEEMPWPLANDLSDDELKALHKYLVSL